MSMVIYLRRVDPAVAGELATDDEKFESFYWEDGEPDDLVDFDVAWHIVHYLLTGSSEATDEPLSIIVSNHEPLGEGWMEEQTALIPAEAMRNFNEALSKVSDDELKARYDRREFVRDDVYASDLVLDEDGPGWEYVSQGIPRLRKFAEKCARENSAAIYLLS